MAASGRAGAVDRDDRLLRTFLDLVAIDSPTGHGEEIGKDLEEAYGKPVGERAPEVRFLCFAGSRRRRRGLSSSCGAPKTSQRPRIHASDESVDPFEIEKMVVAQALLIQRLAEAG